MYRSLGPKFDAERVVERRGGGCEGIRFRMAKTAERQLEYARRKVYEMKNGLVFPNRAVSDREILTYTYDTFVAHQSSLHCRE